MSATVPLPKRAGQTIVLALSLLVAGCAAGAGAAPPQLSIVGDQTKGSGGNVPAAVPSSQPISGGGNVPAPRDDARIVRTGTLQLQVADVARAVDQARTSIIGVGGYISASHQSNTDAGIVATITYRIPVDRWEAALKGLRGLAKKVLNEETEAVEVTGQVGDLEARIRNLQASERALQGIAAQATAIKDVLAVQTELSNVRGQIEQLQAQRNDLVDRAALGTLAVTFGVELVAVVE